METKERTNGVLAACRLVAIVSNGVSIVTTALGLKESYFRETTVRNLLFVICISAVIQLTKACIERIPEKGMLLGAIYVCALLLSSSFSAQAFITAAYPESRFEQVAVTELNASYTTKLLSAQSDVGTALRDAQENVWADFERIRTSLDTEQTGLDPSGMLAKYQSVDSFDPTVDNAYQALARVVDAMNAGEYETARQETTAALAELENETLEGELAAIKEDIETLRRQVSRSGITSELKAQLTNQLTNAVAQQGSLQAKSRAHKLLASDFRTIANSLGGGDASAVQAIQALENELVRTSQDPAAIRSLMTTVVENASADMDLQTINAIRLDVTDYLSLLETNTALLARIEALDTLSEAQAAADSWQSFWSAELNGLRAQLASSSLNNTKKDTYIQDLDTLLRRYTEWHTPQEYMLICLTTKGCFLAWFCLLVAALLDLAGLAANKIARVTG